MATTVAKIKAIGYNSLSLQDSTIVSDDGTSFSGTGPFCLLSNRSIPKNTKVYIELESTTPPNNKDIRHIPLSIGVHKEPSFGILGSDACLCSIYYTKNSYLTSDQSKTYLAFVIREKYAARPIEYDYISNTTGRVPIRGTKIGLGVDMINNTINIFTDGKLFYSYKPVNFDMGTDPAGFYFAIYCPENNEPVSGRINFGRYRTTYLPDGYVDFYQQLYDRVNVNYDIDSRITIKPPYDNTFYQEIMTASAIAENDIAPIVGNRRDIKLILSDPSMIGYKDDDKTIVNYHSFVYHPNDTDLAYIEYPLGTNKRIYFEFHSSEATVIGEWVGIPLIIGLTKDPTDLDKESLQIDLSHLRVDGYHIRTVKDGYTFLAGNYDIRNPIPPLQPNVIGVMVDLFTNTIEIYTEGFLYTIIKPNLNIADFSDPTEPVYFFFKPDKDRFIGEGKVVVNLGTLDKEDAGSGEEDDSLTGYIDEDLRFDIADGTNIASYWWYYNYSIRVTHYKDIPSVMKVISDHISISKYIYASINVPSTTNGVNDEKTWGPGMNTLHGTYNTITRSQDMSKSNVADVSIYNLRKIMEEDANTNKR